MYNMGNCQCVEDIQTVPTTEGLIDVVGLELHFEDEKDHNETDVEGRFSQCVREVEWQDPQE